MAKMMGEKREVKKKLSNSILEMKFMKKSLEAARLEQEAEEGRAMFASELTEAMKLGGVRCIIEPSFVPCEDLILARRSYHGMNPEVERLQNPDDNIECEEEKDVDVPAQEVALVTNMANKFKRGNEARFQQPKKKMKFMKPKD